MNSRSPTPGAVGVTPAFPAGKPQPHIHMKAGIGGTPRFALPIYCAYNKWRGDHV
jgi:hypothetical protein